MRIIAAEINWWLGYGNNPEVRLCIEGPSTLDVHLRYSMHENIYFAKYDELAKFYYWDGTPSEGYGGAKFLITMHSGRQVILDGPWSSCCSHVNMLQTFEPVAECSVYQAGKLLVTAVTTRWLTEVFRQFFPALELYNPDGICPIPTFKGETPAVSKSLIRQYSNMKQLHNIVKGVQYARIPSHTEPQVSERDQTAERFLRHDYLRVDPR